MSWVSTRAWLLYGFLAIGAFASGFVFDAISFKTLLITIFAVVGAFVMTLPLEYAMCVFFIYLGFEGMLKLLTGWNPVVHVGADIMVVALSARWFIGFLLQREQIAKEKPPLIPLFAAHVGWYLVEFANPYSLGLIPSLAGAKMYITMPLLYVYGFYLGKEPRKVRWFIAMWVVTAIIQTVTGLYQGAIGPSSVLSISPAYAQALSKFDGFAFRPFGTNHQPGGAAIFIFLATPFMIYFIFHAKNLFVRLSLMTLLPGSIFVIALCQVRAALLKAIIGTITFIFAGLKQSSAEARKRVAVGIPIAALVLAFALPKITEQWIESNEDNSRALERTLTLFDYNAASNARAGALDRIVHYATTVPLGAGLSRTGSAVGKFWDLVMSDPFYPYAFFSDNFWAAVIAEMGIPGALILTSIIALILLRGGLATQTIANPTLAALQSAIFASLFMVVTGLWGAEGLLYNPEAAYFWFFAGVLMRLPTIEAAKDRDAVLW